MRRIVKMLSSVVFIALMVLLNSVNISGKIKEELIVPPTKRDVYDNDGKSKNIF